MKHTETGSFDDRAESSGNICSYEIFVYHTSSMRGCPYKYLLQVIHYQRNQVIRINDGLEGDAPDDGLIGEDPDGAGGGLEHLEEGQRSASGRVPHSSTCLLLKNTFLDPEFLDEIFHLVRGYLFEGVTVDNKVLSRVYVPAELESGLILFPEEKKT